MTPAPRSLVVLRSALAVVMIGIGVLHFAAADLFVQIVPPTFPAHYALVWTSGAIEIALGVALLAPATRRLAGFGLVALYVAVFPANIYMAVANVRVQGLPHWIPQPSAGALWARLPLQIVFIAWALRASEIWKPRAHGDFSLLPIRSPKADSYP
jgi:uncharacterized membrane protein